MSAASLPTLRNLSVTQAQIVEEACTHFEAAWKIWAQGPPRIEVFLEGIDEPTRSVLLAELLRRELAYRSGRGEVPTLEEYQRRFPAHDWLVLILGALTVVREKGPGSPPTLSAAASAADSIPEHLIETLPHVPGQAASDAVTLVPGYEILGELGRGGMGVVYKARQRALDRVVALKMILTGGHATEADLVRFRTEAKAVARLQHPSIVQIHEVGEHGGLPYFSLEFCSGGSLKDRLAGTPQPPPQAASLVEKLARAMHVAHEKGVIHRDLKPANVLLAEDGTPKITDFGLAKKLDQAGQTQTGAVMGTPSYMAPEQAQGKNKEIGPTCDVYALGAILYECLTGRPPFKAATVMDTLMQVVSEEPVSPRQLNAKVPLDLGTICLKCLQKETARRYDSALSLAEDLQRFQRHEPIMARPVGRVERLSRWCRRNPSLASSIAAGVWILVAGVVVSTYFAVKATWNAQEARTFATAEAKARKRAEASATDEAEARKKAENLAKSEAEARKNAQAQERIAKFEKSKAEFVNYAYRIDAARQAARQNDFLGAQAILTTTEPRLRGWEYDFVYHQTVPTVELIGHTSRVSRVDFSPDGKRIVSAGGNINTGEVKVWDATTGTEVLTLKGHTSFITSVRFSPDGKRIVSGSNDLTVRVWDATTGEEVLTLKRRLSTVYSLSFSPDGKRIVSGNNDPTVRVWDATTGEEVLTLQGHASGVTCVSFSPDGKRIVSGSLDKTVKVWDAATGMEALTFKGHGEPVHSVAFSPDGKRIVSAGGNINTAEVKVWDATTGEEALTLQELTSQVRSMSFSPDGEQIVGSHGRTVKVWDATTGKEVVSINGHTSPVTSVSFSPDGKRIVSSSSGAHNNTVEVKVWDPAMGEEPLTLKGHTSFITSVSFSPDGRRIVSGSYDHIIKVWDAYLGQEALTLQGHTSSVYGVNFSPDGKRIVSGSGDSTVKVWDATTGVEALTLQGHTSQVRSVDYSPDGKRIVSGGGNFNQPGEVKVWDAVTGQETLSLIGHTDQVHSVSFSPDGKRIVSGGNDGTVKVWDATTGAEVLTLQGHTSSVFSVSFSPDGKRFVSGGKDVTVKVWDATTGAEVLTLRGHPSQVRSVSFSPDGKRIVSGSLDKTVKVWDAATGVEALTLQGHTATVFSVSFSPEGKRIVSGNGDWTVKVWDTATGEEARPHK